jgi:hypothetical protein
MANTPEEIKNTEENIIAIIKFVKEINSSKILNP